MCNDIYWNVIYDDWWNINYFNIARAKLIAIKVQLACAVIMLALSVTFIAIYIYTSSKVNSRSRSIAPRSEIEIGTFSPQAPPPPITVWSRQASGWPPSTKY